MPLPRATLHAQGEDLHVAIWPGSDHNTRDITRFIAREGRSFVISASSRLRASDIPADFPFRDLIVNGPISGGENELIHNGGSAIAGPDGEWVIEPDTTTNGVITATIDQRRVLEERQNFDPSGHYARPDLLRLEADRRRARATHFKDEA